MIRTWLAALGVQSFRGIDCTTGYFKNVADNRCAQGSLWTAVRTIIIKKSV